MTTSIIQTQKLAKTFSSRQRGKSRTVEAVRDLDLEVQTGEIFGMLGPNGAGKTTTMRMLSTLLIPTRGQATVAGADLLRQQRLVRRNIGYVGQLGGMLRVATGRENLLLQAQLYGMRRKAAQARVNELLDRLNLTAFADRKTSTYSGGQRRIFDLATGVAHKPTLLFLDEPSTGLDPQNRLQVWQEVRRLHADGTTIFLTTHYLEEADALCDRVAIIDHGKLIALGTPAELKRQITAGIITLRFLDDAQAKNASAVLATAPYAGEIQPQDSTLHVFLKQGHDGSEVMPLVMRTLHDRQIHIKTILFSEPSLNDVFLKLTGRTLESSEEAAKSE